MVHAHKKKDILCEMPYHHRAHGVVASHPLRIRKALGSNPSVSILELFLAIPCISIILMAGLEPAFPSIGGRRLVH